MTDHSCHRSRTVPILPTNLARTSLLGWLVITSFLWNAAQAIEPDTDSADARIVRPLISERTFLVAKFEPAKIALPEITEAIQQKFPGADDVAQRLNLQGEELMKIVRSLRAASRDQAIYATVGIPISANDRPLFFAVETASDVDQPLLLDHLRLTGPEISARVRDGRLIVAPVQDSLIDAVLDAMEPTPREGLSSAFEAVATYPVQLLVLPPDYVRRTIAELVPRLPDELGGGSSDVFTEGVLWAAFGFDPAELRAELVIQSASETAAQRLMEHLPRMLRPGTLARRAIERTLGIDPATAPEEFDSWISVASPLVEVVRQNDRVVLRLGQGGAVTAALPLLAQMAAGIQERLRQSNHSEKFKRILLAMHNYHDVHGMFPPAKKFRDDDGNTQLSWRVHLLPFLGETELFEQFRTDEPWDSPHNSHLTEQMPEIFSPRSPETPGHTTFLAPVGNDTVFGGRKATRFQSIIDGTSNTIVLVEVQPSLAVPWTAPRDYAFDVESPGEGLRLGDDGRFLAGVADGSVQQLRGDLAAELLLRLFRKSDGNPVNWNAVR